MEYYVTIKKNEVAFSAVTEKDFLDVVKEETKANSRVMHTEMILFMKKKKHPPNFVQICQCIHLLGQRNGEEHQRPLCLFLIRTLAVAFRACWIIQDDPHGKVLNHI